MTNFIHIEKVEHQKLLQLYYACHEELKNPSKESTQSRIVAMAACDNFFDGMVRQAKLKELTNA